MKPITPAEAAQFKVSKVPRFVIETFNDLIKNKFDGHSAVIKQDEVVVAIVERYSTSDDQISAKKIFDNHWLDVEPIFKAAGWKVEYDKPGYNESYAAYFKFSK